MSRKAVGLTATKVERANPDRYGDGNGLYLLVRENGNRFWVFRWVRARNMREMGVPPPAAPQTPAPSLWPRPR